MRKVNQRHLVIYILSTCLLLVVLFIGGRGVGLVFGGMFGGRIVDEETKQPVPGAYVIATWNDYSFNRTTCVHMEIDVTDEEGDYFFGPWVDVVGRVVTSQDPPTILVYVPGYQQATYAGPIYVRRYRDSPKKRIREVRRISSLFCGYLPKGRRMVLRRTYRAMYHEAKPLLEQITDDPNSMYRLRVQAIKDDCGKLCE